MLVQIKEWGNSQGIRFSKGIMDLAGIKVNDLLDLNLVNGDIVLKKSRKHKTLEERAKEFGGKIGPYEEFDWGEPVGRERW